jgi:hypothetical protein
MAISIMGGLGGLTVESDPLSLKLTGGTVTGKVNFSPVGGVAGLNVGVGGTSAGATIAGDLWIATGGSSLNFRDGTGAWRVLPSLSGTNAFTSNQSITVNNATTALTVTQSGSGNVLEVRDSNPDSEIFTIDQFGKVGVGVAPDSTAAIHVDGNGIRFANSGSTVADITSSSAVTAPGGWNPNSPPIVVGFNIGGTIIYVPGWIS